MAIGSNKIKASLNKSFWDKVKFFTLLLLFVFALIFMKLFETSDLDENGCPDSNLIAAKNIVLIDATDKIDNATLNLLKPLLHNSQLEQNDWFDNGHKVDQTTFYLLSDENPSDMVPIARFCKKSPGVLEEISKSRKDIEKIENRIKTKINTTYEKVKHNNIATRSQIIKSIAFLTDDSTNWKKGSKFIIISDFEEISSECGNFAKKVPLLNNVHSDCKRWIDIAKANMETNPTDTIQSKILTHEIRRQNMPEGLMSGFWKPYQVYVTGNKDVTQKKDIQNDL